MENNSIEGFIENLAMEICRGQELEQEVYLQIKADLINSAEDIINRELINALSEKKLEEFNKMLDKELSDEEIQTFFTENIDNIDEIVVNALLELKAKFIKRNI